MMKKQNRKKKSYLPIIAATVVVTAAAAIWAPRFFSKAEPQANTSLSAPLSDDGASLMIDLTAVTDEASFYDYDDNGTTVELFAIKASDGSIRLALNTCQVCNGSPYAYFVQEGDSLICQNCGNRFASTQVGVTSGGCNPVPITAEDYTIEQNTILVPTEFMAENAVRFQNWKNF